MVADAVFIHPFSSVTEIAYVPAGRLLIIYPEA
jgi:hypothetical protein